MQKKALQRACGGRGEKHTTGDFEKNIKDQHLLGNAGGEKVI